MLNVKGAFVTDKIHDCTRAGAEGPAARRRVLQAGAAALGSTVFSAVAQTPDLRGAGAWDAGEVAHLLPTANHERVLLKASFRRSLSVAPRLQVADRSVAGQRTDTEGRFWRFDVAGLKPATTYRFQLFAANAMPLCESWPIATFPAPDAPAERLRVLAYTCAGGYPDGGGLGGIETFRAHAIRHALLARGLSFNPDVVIANGDHVYLDQRTWLEAGNERVRQAAAAFYARVGLLDREQTVYGSANEAVLKRSIDPQIAHLYGVRLRSTPVFFFNDDHDYFENDEADEKYVTFPPDAFELELARAVQNMYYPEFLPDAHRTLVMPGSNAADRAPGVSESFGTLRYGRLAEILMYDCGRFMNLKGRHAGLVPPEAEKWLVERTRSIDTRHLIHMPSTPILWSAGKWREWYPDVVVSDELLAEAGDTLMVRWYGVRGNNLRLSTAKKKYMWQAGWFDQHQRLLKAMSDSPRAAINMSGDLHASGWDRILKSGDLDFARNPINVVLNGTLGTGMAGWPSGPRGIAPAAAGAIQAQRNVRPIEKNGFSIIDITPDKVVCRLFAWREPEPFDAIATLEPFDVLEVPRGDGVA